MDKMENGMKLDDAQLDDISGGKASKITSNLRSEDAKNGENPQTKTCKNYKSGTNNYIGTRIQNTCSSCGYLTMGNTRMYCNQSVVIGNT